MTVRIHPLLSDDTYDESLAFPDLPLREQIGNRLAEVVFGADQILMLIDERFAQASRDVIELLPQIRALYDAANDLMKRVEN
jgi:hypothetical protein